MSQAIIVVCGRLAKRIREEAEKLGASVDEYLVGWEALRSYSSSS